MPGRQRLAARNIAAIEKRTTELLKEFYGLMPAMYRDRLLTQDPLTLEPLCIAWGHAWEKLSNASRRLIALRNILQDRAAALPNPPASSLAESDVVENQSSSQACRNAAVPTAVD